MSSHIADVAVPPRCNELIRAGALVAINTSGGKDSQAMTILLSRIVPRDQIVAVHAPLGEVEWPGTIEHIEATLPVGVPLIFAPVASGKTLLERVEERGLWPSNSARWCTSDYKAGPIQRELRRYLKTHPRFGGRLVNAMGIRAEESLARARKPPWRRNDRMSVAGREVFDWALTRSTGETGLCVARPLAWQSRRHRSSCPRGMDCVAECSSFSFPGALVVRARPEAATATARSASMGVFPRRRRAGCVTRELPARQRTVWSTDRLPACASRPRPVSPRSGLGTLTRKRLALRGVEKDK